MATHTTLSRYLKASVLAAGILASAYSLGAAEFRGLWLDAWHNGFLSVSQVTTLVNHCTTYNFNAVIVQMRRRGDAFYIPQSPNLEPRTTALTSGYDALAEIIRQCHAANPRIEVHCWVPTMLIWSDNTAAPTQSTHVYNLHPEYLMKNSSGATYMSEGYYIDPGHPDACMWNYNMAKDIVSRYDIDGFHWDYIRYPQQDAGYNATAISRYKTEFGLSTTPSPSDSQFSTWRRRQVTDFLRWTNSDLLAIKPSLVISASVFASRSDAYTNRFQDWAAWNSEGIIDICMPMNYSSTNSTFNTRVDDAYSNQGVRRAYIGQGAYLNSASNTVTQLKYVRNKSLLGTILYSYAVPNSGTVNQTGTFSYIKTNYQPTYTGTPSIPWKSSPTKGIIKGTVTDSGSAAVYNANVTLSVSPTRTQKTEPHGKYAFFEVAPGTYPISASASGKGSFSSSVTVTAGAVVNMNMMLGSSDTTPPTISNVASGAISSTGATITWTTNEASDSIVEYGLTTAYGQSASATSLVTAHSVSLGSLSASTLYHYRVKSKDASNNQATSGDYTFTTSASGGGSTEYILDNPAASFTGSWTAGSSATDRYGADYQFKGYGTGSACATYTPNLATAGTYDVYEWHPQGTNRTTAAPYVITYSGGSTTVYVNQQTNGGMWNLLGTYSFATGTAGNVKITDNFSDTSQVVIADAVKFVYKGASDVIVDNSNSGFTASSNWTTGTSATDKYGSDYRFRSTAALSDVARWSFNTPAASSYEIYAWWSQGTNRSASAPYIVYDSGGSQTVSKNQQSGGGAWQTLGTYALASGANKVELGCNTTTGYVVIADAIKAVPR